MVQRNRKVRIPLKIEEDRYSSSGGSRPSEKGGPGHPDPEIRGRGGLKKLFSFF